MAFFARKDRWTSPTDPAIAASPVEAIRRDGSRALGDVEPFSLFLPDDATANNGWVSYDLPGPCIVRSSQVGSSEFIQSGNPANQVNTFLYSPGERHPLDTNLAIQSRGVGEGYCWTGGRWWFRGIRLDTNLKLVFVPIQDAKTQPWTPDSCGLGNLHSHLGLKLQPMAEDSVDASLPDSETYYLIGAYRPRKKLLIYVPEVIYEGGADPANHWIDTADAVIDQRGLGVLLGLTPYLFFQNQLARYHDWSLPSEVLTGLGKGLMTIGAGGVFDFSGESRWVGPVLIFNLNTGAPVHVVVEEYT